MKVIQLNGQQGIYSGMNYTSETTSPNICAGCHQLIEDKYLLKAVDQVWHEDCLKCSCCNCRLGEVGSSLFVKANLLLCKQDYLRLFGTPGRCSACLQPIPAFQLVMRAREHVYHVDCFACHHCKLRFCVGDKFYLFDKRIVCEEHYTEEQRKNEEVYSPLLNQNVAHTDNSHNHSPLVETGIDLSCRNKIEADSNPVI